MPVITALLPQPRRRNRIDLYLDQRYVLTLPRALVEDTGLHIGAEVPEERLEWLAETTTYRIALEVSYRYLAHRPRSETEVRTRLRRHKASDTLIERVIAHLKEQRFLDDPTFARLWAESRTAHSPRSGRLVRWELRQHGIDPDLAATSTEMLDDEAAAYSAAGRRAGRLSTADYQGFKKRLGDFLLRRGFSYHVMAHTVERLWQERAGSVPEDSEPDGL